MKKGYGTRGTALEIMHTIPHSFYLPKIIVLCVNFKKMSRRTRRGGNELDY